MLLKYKKGSKLHLSYMDPNRRQKLQQLLQNIWLEMPYSKKCKQHLPVFFDVFRFKQPGHILETCENAQEFLQLADKRVGPWDLELVSKLYDLSKNCLRHKKSKRWNIKQVSWRHYTYLDTAPLSIIVLCKKEIYTRRGKTNYGS